MSDRTRGVLLAIVASLFTSFAQLAFKEASVHATLHSWTELAGDIRLWLGIASYFLSFLFTMKAYRLGDLSLIFPLISICYVWNLFLGHWILHETLNLTRIAGTVLVLAGSAVIARGEPA